MTRIRCDGKGRRAHSQSRGPGTPVLVVHPTRGRRYRRRVHDTRVNGWPRRRCICAPTPAASAVTWPNSPTRRWPAGSTSSNCATRARRASSSSGRSRPARSWKRSRCSPTRRAATTRCWRSTTAPISRVAAGADVLHLGQDDLPLPIARDIIGAGPLIGRSTHDVAQVKAATSEAVDYFCVGPCWPTPTKPGRPAPGLDLVRAPRPNWERTNRGSRSAASTNSDYPRCWRPALAESSSCARSPAPRIRGPRRNGSKLGLSAG